MNAWLVAIALGLLAAWPLTVAGSLIGFLAERLTRSPRVREIAWGATFLLPFLFLLQVLGGRIFAGAPAATPAVAAHAARVHLTVPLSSFAPPSAPPLFETWLARPEAVWIAVAILALSLGGAIARVAMWTAGKQRLSYVIKRASALDAPDLDRELAHEAAHARITPPPVLVSEEIDRPMLAGLRHPAILIPAEAVRRLDAERLRLIGLHELAHLRRGDNLRRPLEEALLGLFCMTPLLGLVRARMAAATEEACDHRALRGADPAVRRLYAQALVDTLRLGAGPEHAPAFIGAGRRSHLMRMNAILNPARPARPFTVAVLCGAGAALVISAGFAAKTAVAQATAAQPDPAPAPAPATLTVTTQDVGVSRDNKLVTLSLDGTVDVGGKRVSLKGKPMRVVVDAGDGAKLVHIRTSVDVDKDTRAEIEETIDPKGVKVKDGQTIYLIEPDGKSPQSYTITPTGEKKDFHVVSGGVTVIRDDRAHVSIRDDRAAHSSTIVSPTSADGGSIDLEADRLVTDKDKDLTVYVGNPSIHVTKGTAKDVEAVAIAYQLNGKPAPAGFDPSTIAPDQLDRIEVQTSQPSAQAPGREPGMTVNLITKTPAG